MTDFKPGDKAISESGREFEVVFGPYPVFGGAPSYLVKGPDGYGIPVLASALSHKPTDPRREVVAKAICERMNSATTWDELVSDYGPSGTSAFLADADAVIAALDAHAQQEANPGLTPVPLKYDAPARYRDSEGDTWELQPDGTYTCLDSPADNGWAYKRVARLFGPLTLLP